MKQKLELLIVKKENMSENNGIYRVFIHLRRKNKKTQK